MSKVSYNPPDFAAPALAAAPDVRVAPAPISGVVPPDFYSTTNFPTYIKTEASWLLVADARMDAVIVLDQHGPRCLEPRNVVAGMPVVLGQREHGEEGIFVNENPFIEEGGTEQRDVFSFMSSGSSRERPTNYAELAELLHADREQGGKSVWVLGPAVVHSGAREQMEWLVNNGYVGVLFAGNALAAHDLEMSSYRTSLGIGKQGKAVRGGHRHHIATINQIRAYGSIERAVQEGYITDGIIHACVKQGVPFVLAGSIRDDGPLPGVITDVREAQTVMREHTKRATLAVMLATALHSIATGNMLPTFYQRDGELYPLPIIAVDQDEFILSKLVDRGTHQAFGIARNAHDFLLHMTHALHKMQ